MARRRVRESEAAGLRQAASRRLARQPFPAIVAWMDDEGYRTTLGGKFRPGTLANLLDNPAIAGLAEDENGELYETGGPQIISPEEFKQMRAQRRVNQEGYSRGKQKDYLFTGTGTAPCGLCGTEMSAAPSNSGSRGYRCPPSTAQHPGGCGKVRIAADAFEVYVAEHVLAELAKPQVAEQLLAAQQALLAEAEQLRKRNEADREKQKSLGEEYASTDMSGAAFRSADKALSQRIRETSVEIRRLEQVKNAPLGGVPDLVRWWKHAPLQGKRAVLVLLLEKAAVYPAASRGSRTVDSNRVALTWRVWGSESAAEKPTA
ncbi:recombinase family protein [Streptomyces sp. NPDC095613]|uniref:recombinase family protein n=1 Tax=Streptomyces sp. NPDC095613 TaxID=3155540 RepID=UPI003328A32E